MLAPLADLDPAFGRPDRPIGAGCAPHRGSVAAARDPVVRYPRGAGTKGSLRGTATERAARPNASRSSAPAGPGPRSPLALVARGRGRSARRRPQPRRASTRRAAACSDVAVAHRRDRRRRRRPRAASPRRRRDRRPRPRALAPSLEPGALVVHLVRRARRSTRSTVAAARPDVRASASLHPLQSLADAPTRPRPPARRRGARSRDRRASSGSPLALGLRPFDVPTTRPRRATTPPRCVASNHLVALLGQVERLAAARGVPFEAFLPLVRATLDNVARSARRPRSPARWRAATSTRSPATSTRIPDAERDAYRALAREAGSPRRRDEPSRARAGCSRDDRVERDRTTCGQRVRATARHAGADGRARADDGLLPRGPPLADARRRAQHDLVVVDDLREPAPVRAERGPRRATRATSRATRAVAEAEGVDLLFAPSVDEMYPRPTPHHRARRRPHRPGSAARTRPTHFDGVTTVVAKLFSIVGPCRRLLRPQGLPAARGRAADGRRPRPAGRGRRLPARARARRARDVEPQRLPRRRRARARAGVLSRRCATRRCAVERRRARRRLDRAGVVERVAAEPTASSSSTPRSRRPPTRAVDRARRRGARRRRRPRRRDPADRQRHCGSPAPGSRPTSASSHEGAPSPCTAR